MPTPRRASRRRTCSRPYRTHCGSVCRHLLQTTPATWPSPCRERGASPTSCWTPFLLMPIQQQRRRRHWRGCATRSRGKGCGEVPAPQQPRRMRDKPLRKVLSLDSLSRCCWASAAVEGETPQYYFNECTARARCGTIHGQATRDHRLSRPPRNAPSTHAFRSCNNIAANGRAEPPGAVERGLRLRHGAKKGPHPLCRCC